MIQEFIDRFEANKSQLRGRLEQTHPDSYLQLFTWLIEVLATEDYSGLDPKRIHVIDDGDYQGMILFLVAEQSYQPSQYWSAKVFYGSCSACDTLQGIRDSASFDERDNAPSAAQVESYLTLALHLVQSMREIE